MSIHVFLTNKTQWVLYVVIFDSDKFMHQLGSDMRTFYHIRTFSIAFFKFI